MKSPISLTVFIPAYNEEGNIAAAIKSVDTVLAPLLSDYELMVVDDGSTDQTAAIVKQIAKNDKHLVLVRHSVNMGLAQSFRDCIAASKKEYITQLHGDNDASADFLSDFVKMARSYDMVSIYPLNSSDRSGLRKFISSGFVFSMNLLFGLHLRYFNGAFIAKTSLLRSLHIASKGLAVYAEVKVRLLARGLTFAEVPFEHRPRKTGVSKAVSFQSVLFTLQTMIDLLRER